MSDHQWEGSGAPAQLPDPDDDDDDGENDNDDEDDDDDMSHQQTVEDPTVFTKPTHSTNATTTTHKQQQTNEDSIPHYILGTLVVRVVAARNLEAVSKQGGGGGLGSLVFRKGHGGGDGSGVAKRGGGGHGGTANPYASVKFGTSTQRTSEVYDTVDPVWPRQEAMFMDVSLPVEKIAHADTSSAMMPSYEPIGAVSSTSVNPTTTTTTSGGGSGSSATATNQPNDENESSSSPPSTILTIALFHAAEMGRATKFAKGGLLSGDSNDLFLGMASINLQRLLTGRDHTFDGWLQLSGTESSRGHVRLVCEYEPSDPSPRPGDYCRFTRFCNPKDLYPLQVGRQYKVAHVDGDIVLISYETSEGWVCSFQAHRFMLICEERHYSTVEAAQDEFASVAERLAHSPLVHTIAHTVERVAVEGILSVGEEIAKSGVGLFQRWFTGGVDTVVADVANVINWDGRHNPDVTDDLDLPNLQTSSHDGEDEGRRHDTDQIGGGSGGRSGYDYDDDPMDSKPRAAAISQLALPSTEPEALPNMPACPITGFPMVDPVVAADGHTYERSAIARWLATSNKSPMTGSILPHKELVTNYGLVSSVQESAAAAAAQTVSMMMMMKNHPQKSPSELSLSSRIIMTDIPRKIEVDESASVTPSGLFSLDGLETVTMGGGGGPAGTSMDNPYFDSTHEPHSTSRISGNNDDDGEDKDEDENSQQSYTSAASK